MKNLEEEVVKLLAKQHFTVSTAESCTGGLLAGQIVNVSGASEVFHEGYITYSNEAKERLIGVSSDTLRLYGAVSEQTAREMAAGVAAKASSNASLATTGIAGPEGGSADKPVGLVYIGCFLEGDVTVKEFRFQGDREENRRQAVGEALQILKEQLIRRYKDEYTDVGTA